jgi:hypothetical protein
MTGTNAVRREVFEDHIRDEKSEVFVVVATDGSLEGMLSCFEAVAVIRRRAIEWDYPADPGIRG